MSERLIKEAKSAIKRALHFAGPYEPCRLGWGDWAALIPTGRYAFVENWIAMRESYCHEPPGRQERLYGMKYVDGLEWHASLAAAINRYIDSHHVKDDPYFWIVLRWFQQETLIDWSML